MLEQHVSVAGMELDGFVAAFESARSADAQADLCAFLPEPNHPLYQEVLRELVRVDLELSWEHGRGNRLEGYQRRFPQLFETPEDLQAIAFE
ncbi:MAG TPA: hypothetical protein VE988_19275, partial [Gemmataceae bacterium]|nr:hypothetical protein [Gemmataceae bacterium]